MIRNEFFIIPFINNNSIFHTLNAAELRTIVGRLFCFKMRICCRFTVRKQEILLNYVGTLQWEPHNGDSMAITLFKFSFPQLLVFINLIDIYAMTNLK